MTDTLQGGYFKEGPEGAPAVVIIHEWWGLNAHLRGIADRFAAAGFTAFAIDLFGGQVAAAGDTATAQRLVDVLQWPAALASVGAARQALKTRAPGAKVGVVGFCIGGALALAAASKHPFDACVPFYGIPQPQVADLATISCPVLGHYAQHDDWCTPARVDALQKQLPGATLHRYDAHHAFFNDTRPEVYSKAQATLAWERTVGFLSAQLKA